MKRKGTRKVRKNKRTTQRRKNRSYKRMRGGLVMNGKKIMGLLKNLILHNSGPSTQIAKFCKNQQQSNIPSTNQQLLLPSVFLEDSEKIDEWICLLYRTNINKPNNKFTFNSFDPIQQNIIKTLQTKGISDFDKIVSAAGSLDIDILPLDGFESSLKSLKIKSLKNFGGIIISDKLVYSMFALSVEFLTILAKQPPITVKYTVDPIECPSLANDV